MILKDKGHMKKEFFITLEVENTLKVKIQQIG